MQTTKQTWTGKEGISGFEHKAGNVKLPSFGRLMHFLRYFTFSKQMHGQSQKRKVKKISNKTDNGWKDDLVSAFFKWM